ncbi:uncharacterized protein LOC122505302 [Leptopilina heterotoma]|uniref:uncharacterized protein LOC122505302 n=1 Tax=Leptopilina heterotoma TaxID=63436 RepID=UPI001CA9629E|nr:uncharacterized protein LOC122505302 [Leptopilina heterotoma]
MSRVYSKSARFFPNECCICRSREKLIRCECNMISYCSEDHRQQHQSTHKDFCKVVKELLKIKRITHIHEELIFLIGSKWTTKKEEIRYEIIKKLGRGLSPLETAMWNRPRICFVCHETKQVDLNNCPHCPVATFCKKHKHDEIHDQNCKVMSTYLNILTTANALNIDLDFLSSTFPFVGEGLVFRVIDNLTHTFKLKGTQITSSNSKLSKSNLILFTDIASKINSALNTIHDTIPEELTIHIDALSSKHVITKENYWEFLLHLNPQIRKLKIVIIQTENQNNSKKSLCKTCHSEGKELIIEHLSKSYEDYILDGNYQKPDLLFYVKVDDESNSEILKKCSEFSCPIVLRFESNSNFCKTQHFLLCKTAKFGFIYEGQIKAPFSTLSSIENKDYFIIFQSKGNEVLEKSCDTATGEITEKNIGTTSTEILVDRNRNKEQKVVDRVTISPSSSSKRSFATISEAEEEKNKKSKTENCNNCSKSIDKENFDPNGDEGKLAKDKVNSSQSYLIEHISYLKKENEGLRQQLDLSISEVTKFQTKFEKVSLDSHKKDEFIKKMLRDIVGVDFGATTIKDSDSLCENNNV